LPRPPITPIEEMGRIPLSDVSDTPPHPISFSLDARTRAEVERRIDDILGDPLPNGKGKRTKLPPTERHKFRSALIEVVEYAHSLAAKGPLPNRVPGQGPPPDNAKLIFVEDIVHECEVAGLKPGLRFIEPESLPVRLFKELASLLWRPVKDPRRVFQRWRRYRETLVRG
jgi:hypothetical protein